MSRTIQKFRIIRRPATVNSSFSLVVVDAVGRPHLPLTTFYHRLGQQLADGTARTYLNSLLAFFTYLTTDAWRQQRGDQWNSPPDAVQEAVRDFLVECLPRVSFNPQNQRAHRFPTPRPYLFQYNHRHFSEQTINACLRFVCHGLVIQTIEGKQIKLKAHLLRHVFAAHLHHVEAVPLDVIAVILHQKNVQITAYYAAPPWQQVLATANSLLDKFATHLGAIEDVFVRAPAELQRQLEEAKTQVGTLNNVPGGQCTCHAICPIAFACTGCVYNVPDPDREEEILEQEQWAFIRLEQVKRRGQGPEIVKMQALIQRCRVTRQEMQCIRIYRKDETYVPIITVERTEQGRDPAEAVVAQALRSETSEDGHARQSRRRSAHQKTANGDD